MKKIIITIIIMVSFCCIFQFKKPILKDTNNYIGWDYIGNCTDFDKKSIKETRQHKTASFRLFVSNQCNSYKTDNKKVDYVNIKYDALCDKGLLRANYIKQYDEYGNLIKIKKQFIYHSFNKIADGKLFYNTLCSITKYNKSDTISLNDYLYSEKSNSDILKLNENNDVIFNDKVVLTNANVPLNDNTAYTYTELKILYSAKDIKPKNGCNPNDVIENGVLGCYMD